MFPSIFDTLEEVMDQCERVAAMKRARGLEQRDDWRNDPDAVTLAELLAISGEE